MSASYSDLPSDNSSSISFFAALNEAAFALERAFKEGELGEIIHTWMDTQVKLIARRRQRRWPGYCFLYGRDHVALCKQGFNEETMLYQTGIWTEFLAVDVVLCSLPFGHKNGILVLYVRCEKNRLRKKFQSSLSKYIKKKTGKTMSIKIEGQDYVIRGIYSQ